ncbi:MAG: plasmid pRiA4b ORF-3 family protein [candidate division Zixibacteria bacterium]
MSDKIYQIKISLLDIKPLIWRRVAVSGNVTLAKLHKIIQTVMGWENYHLHEFRYKGVVYAVPDPEFDNVDVVDDRKAKLSRMIKEPKQQFSYTYDFGDGWGHRLLVEKISDPEPEITYPICMGGERACPPEDCGGTYGYENFLEAIGDLGHEEHETMLEWIGGEFDANEFSVEETNEILADEFKSKSVK